MKKGFKSGLSKIFGPIFRFYTKNSPRNSWSPLFMITLWNQKSWNAGTSCITLRIYRNQNKTISRSAFSSQILQNAEMNIIVHWKLWRKYGSVSSLFSCNKLQSNNRLLFLKLSPALYFLGIYVLFLHSLFFQYTFWKQMLAFDKWYFVTKIVLTYCETKLF